MLLFIITKIRAKDQCLAFDMLSDFGLGTRIGLLDSPENQFILRILHLHTVKLGVYEQWPALDRLGIADSISCVLSAISPTVKSFNKWYLQFTERPIKNNRDTTKGILGPLGEGMETGKSRSGHTREQMLAEISFAIFTGTIPDRVIHFGLQRL